MHQLLEERDGELVAGRAPSARPAAVATFGLRSPTRFSSHWISGEKLASFRAAATADCSTLFFIRKVENCSISLRGSAALVSPGSTRRIASADRSGSCRGIVAEESTGLRKGDDSTPVKCIKDPDDLGDGAESLRRIELSKRRRAFDQGDIGTPHPREVKLSLRESAGALE